LQGDTTTDGGDSSPIRASGRSVGGRVPRFDYNSVSDSDSGRGSGEPPLRMKTLKKKQKKTPCPIDTSSGADSDSTTYSYVDYCGNHPSNNDEEYCGNQPDINGVQLIEPTKANLTLLSPSDVEQGFFDEPTTMLSAHSYYEVLAYSDGEGGVDTDADTLSVSTSDIVEEPTYQQSQPIPSLADIYMDISDSEVEPENIVASEVTVTAETDDQTPTVSLTYIITPYIVRTYFNIKPTAKY
jgi:hypothetical protein